MKNNNDNIGGADVYEIASKKSTLSAMNDGDEISIRKFMILRLLKIIPELENKILHGRIKDKESEKIRLDYFRQYINLCNCINNFTKDATIGDSRFDKNVLKGFLDVDIVDDFDIIENDIAENPD